MTEEQRDELFKAIAEGLLTVLRDVSCRACSGTGAITIGPHRMLHTCPECKGHTVGVAQAARRLDDVLRRLAGRPDQ